MALVAAVLPTVSAAQKRLAALPIATPSVPAARHLTPQLDLSLQKHRTRSTRAVLLCKQPTLSA